MATAAASSSHPTSSEGAPSANPPTSNGAALPGSAPALTSAQTTEAERKRAHRAQKKAEQQARKDERKRFAAEHGVDPADLPPTVAGALRKGKASGDVQPKGFTPRSWVDVPESAHSDADGQAQEGRRVSILSWNMLAQALVRRELFPGSDCLKGKDRLPALMEQVLYYAPDIACLQEVDRLSDHLPSLTLSYGYTSFVGYQNKAHGLLVAHKSSVFNKVGERGIRLDDLPIDDSPLESLATRSPSSETAPEGEESYEADDSVSPANATDTPVNELTEKEKEVLARPPDAPSSSRKAARRAAGLSRATRNVGLFVALEFKDAPGRGVIVGTTHTFWHPTHVYERVRQTALLVKELEKFREEAEDGRWKEWPLFLAGDLNTQPCELTYRLLTGAPISPRTLEGFDQSRVVHQSVDRMYDPDYEPPEPPAPEPKEGDNVASDDLSQHPDRIIKNARIATDEDGLATLEQLQALFRYPARSQDSVPAATAASEERRIRSAYGEAYGLIPSQAERWYCARRPEVQMGNGTREPEPAEEAAARQEGAWAARVQRGDFEPLYTNFTPLWRCTLDYILLLPPSPSTAAGDPSLPPKKQQPKWRKLLEMHDFAERCEPGLPRKGIEPSDHVAIGTVVEIF